MNFTHGHELLACIENSGAACGLLNPTSAKSDLEIRREDGTIVYKGLIRGCEAMGRLNIELPIKAEWALANGRLRPDFVPYAAGLIVRAIRDKVAELTIN